MTCAKRTFYEDCGMYLFHKEMFLHQIPQAVRVVSVVWMNVELQGMEVATEKEQPFGEFDVLFLQNGRLHLPDRVNGVERDSHT